MPDFIDLDTERASRYIKATLDGFLKDPPDSEFQRGYLRALLDLYVEGLHKVDPEEDPEVNVLLEMTKQKFDE